MNRRADLFVIIVLLLTAAVIGLPILRGGYITYMDNPNHLAEIASLAAEGATGWSDIAFCGMPLSVLNSPLAYGALSTWTRIGLPTSALYLFVLWLSCAAPALAVYVVARGHLRPLLASILAYFVLVQRTAIAGEESVYGGMWTWYLAMAGVVLLMREVSKADRSPGTVARIAALLGFIGLTHTFALVVAVVVMMVHAMWLLLSRPRRLRTLLLDMAAAFLAALASAAYWLPLLQSRDALMETRSLLPFSSLLLRLIVPTDIVRLHLRQPAVSNDLYLTDALPLLLLVVLGIAGTARVLLWKRDRLPSIAAAVSVVLLILLAIDSIRHLQFLGSITWRYLYPVRIGFALAGIASLHWLAPRLPSSLPRGLPVGLGIVGIAAGFWFGSPLARAVPDVGGKEMVQVQSLWDWIGGNRDAISGRLYVQDTFMTPPLDALAKSHILSLTAAETRARQVGAWFGAMPLHTATWTKADFGVFLGMGSEITRDPGSYAVLLDRLSLANVGAVVLSNPDLAEALEGKAEFERLYSVGRFTVLRNLAAVSDWADPTGEGMTAVVTEYEPGRITLEVVSARPNRQVAIREAWHPFWSVVSPPEARISQLPYGLTRIEGIPAGENEVTLRWTKPRSGTWLSLIGWIGVFVVFVSGRRQSMKVRDPGSGASSNPS